MANIWTKFKSLLPTDIVQIGTVQQVYNDGTSLIQLIGGGTIRVNGASVSTGNNCYIKNGAITQQAPNLPQHEVTIY